MWIKELTIRNLRAIKYAHFDFHPRMNLLVGVNGVGKTTVLEALRNHLSHAVQSFTHSKNKHTRYVKDDVTHGEKRLTTDGILELKGENIRFYAEFMDAKHVKNLPKQFSREFLNDVSLFEMDGNAFHYKAVKEGNEQPLAIYFGTRRSHSTEIAPPKNAASEPKAAAYAGAFSEARTLEIRFFADWMLAQQKLQDIVPQSKKRIKLLRNAVDLFLPDCNNLQVVEGKESKKGKINYLTIDKNGNTLKINQLSDGERSLICLVLDLSIRLMMSNPKLDNPIRDGEAIVLIDEIDLHLHPTWQRRVVPQLMKTFENCQFIASTHSPQVIPSAKPDQVFVIDVEGVIRPERTYGLDSNWVLNFIMNAGERDEVPEKYINEVEALIDNFKLKEARKKILEYRESIPLPEWDTFLVRIKSLEIFGDETDN